MRIASFLPSATEIVYALGQEDSLVAVSHECDYPRPAREKTVVVHSAVDSERLSSGEIDRAVRDLLARGESIYQIDETRLKALAPQVILTQDLCQVCAPSGNAVTDVLKTLSPAPDVLWLTPRSLDDIAANIREVAVALGCVDRADAVIANMRERLTSVAARVASAPRLRVSFMEWVDPIYCGGHWVPEMIELAGGEDRLSRRHADSVRVEWKDIVAWAPEVLIVAPCGYDVARATEDARKLPSLPGWDGLPAVRENKVFVVDANSFFARPGPRVVDGTELLAHLLHPDLVDWCGPADAFATLGSG
jgi:iron complex transport system substrate-binding protein